MKHRLNIFISYRRSDSRDFAGRLYDNLQNDYDVFLDTEDGIPYGEKFLSVIVNEIEKADIFLMVIGKDSCAEFKEREGGDDYVIKEIVHAKASNCKIIPVLIHEAKIPNCFPEPITFVSDLNIFKFGEKFSMYLQELKSQVAKEQKHVTKELCSDFISEVLDGIEQERLVVLFSQDFTNIHQHYENIKLEMQGKFKDEFYAVAIPAYVDEQEEYFTYIANDCGMSGQVEKVNDWNFVMRKKLKACENKVLLFITEIENGNEKLDRQFATILRNLSSEFSHFHAIFVGRKNLAKLVYEGGDLSPLNNAKELFSPDEKMKLGEVKIAQQFQSMKKHKERVCRLLNAEKLERFTAWSDDEVVNQLFWKNLLLKEGVRFAWRGELTKEVARDVLGCV